MLCLRRDNGKLEYGLGAFLSLDCGASKEAGELMTLRSFLV